MLRMLLQACVFNTLTDWDNINRRGGGDFVPTRGVELVSVVRSDNFLPAGVDSCHHGKTSSCRQATVIRKFRNIFFPANRDSWHMVFHSLFQLKKKKNILPNVQGRIAGITFSPSQGVDNRDNGVYYFQRVPSVVTSQKVPFLRKNSNTSRHQLRRLFSVCTSALSSVYCCSCLSV